MTIALWCLFFAGLFHILSKVPLFRAQLKSPAGYDNNHPREQQQALEGSGKRALAAHQNQLESFPLFAAGVLVASFSGVTSALVSYLAVAYIISRIAYLYCYVNDIAMLRTTVWLVGYASSLALICSPAWGM
jgi:Predicted membrane protein